MGHSVSLCANVMITARRAGSGRLVKRYQARNLFTRSGRRQLRDLIMYPLSAEPLLPSADDFGTPATPDFIAIGSGGTATVDLQEALGTEVFRKSITFREPQTSGFKLQLYVDPSEANGAGTQELREVGLFTGDADGLLWARATHPLISKTSLISVTYDWTFTFTAS